jgi:hypothetical protein
MRTDLAAGCVGEAVTAAAIGAGVGLEMDGDGDTASESSSETVEPLQAQR